MTTQRLLYQSCYCEENIWHLCHEERFQHGYAVFIASLGDYFPMWSQRKAELPGGPVFWDYHVILLLPGQVSRVFDFDTNLGFETECQVYFQHSFPNPEWLGSIYQPLFRLVPVETYIQNFRSDRSHMQTADGWLAEPPEWPAIGSGGTNLEKFIDMRDDELGEVIDYQNMLKRFA